MHDQYDGERSGQQAEHLSAFMDDGLNSQDARNLADGLSSNQSLQAKWAEWHLIGDVMRSASLAKHHQGAASFGERLKSEPIHLAQPQSKPWVSDSLALSNASRRRRPRMIYAGAAAAAVVFVAVVALAPQMQSVVTPAFVASSGPAKPVSPTQLEDPRLRELMDRHGSMAIRPVSDTR